MRGRLTRVAPTSIELADASSAVRDFDQAVVLRVEHAFEKSGRTAGRTFRTGFLVSVGLGLGVMAIMGGGSGFGDAFSDPNFLVGFLGGAAIYGALLAGSDALGPGKPLRNRLIYSR